MIEIAYIYIYISLGVLISHMNRGKDMILFMQVSWLVDVLNAYTQVPIVSCNVCDGIWIYVCMLVCC